MRKLRSLELDFNRKYPKQVFSFRFFTGNNFPIGIFTGLSKNVPVKNTPAKNIPKTNYFLLGFFSDIFQMFLIIFS